MISSFGAEHDLSVADFWVVAWSQTMPDIDFEARRPWILAHLADMRADGQVVRGLFHGHVVVGFYTLFPATGLLEQICVDPQVAGQGIGKELILDARRHTAQNLNLVVNSDNLDARRFYARLGFQEGKHSTNPVSGKPVVALTMG
jgi:putative acetyltransferase